MCNLNWNRSPRCRLYGGGNKTRLQLALELMLEVELDRKYRRPIEYGCCCSFELSVLNNIVLQIELLFVFRFAKYKLSTALNEEVNPCSAEGLFSH